MGSWPRSDGSHPWGYEREDEVTKNWKLGPLRRAGAHLMGRVTYATGAAGHVYRPWRPSQL